MAKGTKEAVYINRGAGTKGLWLDGSQAQAVIDRLNRQERAIFKLQTDRAELRTIVKNALTA